MAVNPPFGEFGPAPYPKEPHHVVRRFEPAGQRKTESWVPDSPPSWVGGRPLSCMVIWVLQGMATPATNQSMVPDCRQEGQLEVNMVVWSWSTRVFEYYMDV